MTDKINYDSMKKLFDEQLRTFVQKNSDYGNSFERSLESYGLLASIIRMEDKMNRLSTLAQGDKDAQIASESLADTLMDLSNYAAMSACWLMHKDDESVYDPEMYDSDRIFSISTDIYTKDFQMLSAVINGSVEEEEFEGRFNDLKETVFEQINSSREVVTTELKGLENGYFIRQHKNSHNSYRYTLAFNPEGTLKVEGDVAKPYVIECFSNDHDGTNTWAIHVFDTREDMVAALNYDLRVRRSFESKNFGDSIKELDVNVVVFAHPDVPKVLNIWDDTFGEAFDNQMLSKNLNTEESIEKYQGIKTFGPVFISEKTGALVVKCVLRESATGRNHNIIWFSDTKEVLLELKNTIPKFNANGIIYGIDSKHIKNGDRIDFNPLYGDMEDKILSKFNSCDETELKNLVFFNEDDAVSCEFMDKKFEIPSDSPSANAKNTVGEHELSLTFDKLKQEDISFSGLENSYFLRHKYVGKTSDDAALSYTLSYTPGATIDIPKLNIDNKHFVLESCRKSFDIRLRLYVFETLEDLVETLYHNEQYPTADMRECFNHSVIHSNRKHPVRVYHGNTVKDLVINHLGSDKLYGRGFKSNFRARHIYDNPKFQNDHGVKLFDTVRLIEDTETIVVKGVVIHPGIFKNGALGSHGFIWFSDTKEVILSDEGVTAVFNSDGALYGVLYDEYWDKNSPEYNNIYTNWSIIFQDSESIFIQDTLK